MTQAKYVGYMESDKVVPFARFYNEHVLPIPEKVEKCLTLSPYPAGSLPALADVTYLLSKNYQKIEIGFSLETDGSAHVAILTDMPNVLPKMWDWWFAWHGSQDNRYKLWHPKAHISARWEDGRTDILAYVGRTSLIEEYIGKKLEKAAIHFIAPSDLGLQNTENEVFICARVGYSHIPINIGWLVHQVRKTNAGAEMRSRFWMGGKYIEVRKTGFVAKTLSQLLPKFIGVSRFQASDLLRHCSEEMNHLAAILPTLYKEFGNTI